MTATTAWMVTRLGAPTDALEIQTVDVGEPGTNQVRISVEAFCLDFNDIDTIRGRYGLLRFEPPFVIGMAAAGTVDAVGPGCEGLLERRVVGTTAACRVPTRQRPCWTERRSNCFQPGSVRPRGSRCISPFR